jgi:hypothetical protein
VPVDVDRLRGVLDQYAPHQFSLGQILQSSHAGSGAGRRVVSGALVVATVTGLAS